MTTTDPDVPTPTGTFRTAVTGARDEAPEPVDQWPAQELRVAAPMLATIREHLDERVVAHIIGGMQCPGRLTSINEDDGTFTLAAGENIYTVALHAVAVLVTS